MRVLRITWRDGRVLYANPRKKESLAVTAKKIDAFHARLKKKYGRRWVRGKNPDQPIVYFTMGLPGAGKSTYIEEHFKDYINCCLISSDDLAMKHPLYDPKAPQAAHAAVAPIVERMFEEYVNRRQSFIIDGTAGKYAKLIRRIQEAKAAGFRVVILYITVPLSVAMARNHARERTIPDSEVIAIASRIEGTFEKIKPYADEIRVIDRSGPLPT